jgi:tRNA (guanine-N7-)-methyltransferase
LPSVVEPLDLQIIFGRRAPLHVDLGCGDGAFLCALAQRLPEKNFLGIERLLGRVNAAASKAARIGNVRVLRVESSYALHYLLPARSVETFYLLFPDPWPKRRHHRRRLVTADFLQSIAETLGPDGKFHIATDQRDYFEQIIALAAANPYLARAEASDVDLPCTNFEARFRAEAAPIYRLLLRKISPVR